MKKCCFVLLALLKKCCFDLFFTTKSVVSAVSVVFLGIWKNAFLIFSNNNTKQHKQHKQHKTTQTTLFTTKHCFKSSVVSAVCIKKGVKT